MPKTQYSSEYEAEDAKQRGQLIEIHERACKFFEDQLRRPEGAHAREYLAGRGSSLPSIRVRPDIPGHALLRAPATGLQKTCRRAHAFRSAGRGAERLPLRLLSCTASWASECPS